MLIKYIMAYEQRRKELFFERKDVSQKNKGYVEDFFLGYNCAKTTEGRFYSWLPYFLRKTPDVKKTMLDTKEMQKIFNELHRDLSPSSYRTVQTTVKTLCKVLNNGEIPEAFKHIMYLTKQEKKKLARINKKGYKTLSWKDGLKMAEIQNNMMYKALIMTELDGGLRPAELEALDYGDCKKDGKFIILNISESKTGEARDVLIYRAASFLNRWLQLHPTKKKSDPLWIMQNQNMSSKYRKNPKLMRLDYDAMRQCIARTSKRAGLGRVSLYMMRHSAVALAKQERLGVDLAAEKFGHDINYYINTYGKLTPEQKINRFKGHYGEVAAEEENKTKTQLCPVCDTINEPEVKYCEKCNNPLSLKVALEQEKNKDTEIDSLKKQMQSIQQEQIAEKVRMEKILRILELQEKAKKIK